MHPPITVRTVNRQDFAAWKPRLVARAIAVANQPGDRAKLLVRRCARQAFNRAVEVDDALTDWGHDGSAAMLSAGRGCHCRLAQRLINLFNQEPSPAIGHSQVSRRGRNRPLGANGFEQRDLARTDAVTVGKVETNREVRIGHGPGSPRNVHLKTPSASEQEGLPRPRRKSAVLRKADQT